MVTSPTQARELLDLVLSFPRDETYSLKYEYDSKCGVDLWFHGNKTCECCGKLVDVFDHIRVKEFTDEVRAWIEDKKNYIKEDKND